MARNQKSKNKNNSYRPNFWGMMQNLLLAALNKGQLLPMTFALVLIVFIIRYPQEQLPDLLDNILSISGVNSTLGWILSGITTFAAFLITRWQRRIHTKEIKRISDEKKLLQQQLSKNKLPSSNK